MAAMVRLLISVPMDLKKRLNALRAQGTSASGYIRHLLERELNAPKSQNARK